MKSHINEQTIKTALEQKLITPMEARNMLMSHLNQSDFRSKKSNKRTSGSRTRNYI
jgi:hypothetical protein